MIIINVDNFNSYEVEQAKQVESILPYYEVYDYSQDLRDNTTQFASDNNYFQVTVETSEELYWAVENHYTPICVKNSRAELIYGKAKDILNEIIGNNMTDFEKALSIFDYICSTTTYDKRDFSSQTILASYKITHIPSFYLEGVFINGFAVCDGFSKAFSLLCNMEGLDCVRIVGNASQRLSSENHAWNKVKIDNEWYLVDATWGELTTGSTERLTHKYFLITDNLTKESHFPNKYREKFNNYPTSLTAYDFYSNYNISHTYSNGTTVNSDLFINSDSEFINVIEYCFLNEMKHIELFMERNYVISQLTTNTNNSAYQYVLTKINTIEFDHHVLTCYFANNDYYCQTNISGCIVVIEIENILTSKNNLDSFVNYLKTEKINNDYYFYLSESYLNSIYSSSLSFQNKIDNLQNSYSKVDLEFIGAEKTYNINKKAYLIKLTFL